MSCRLMIIWMLINSVADGLVLNVAMCLLQIWKLQVVVRLDPIYLSIPHHSCLGMYSFSLQWEVSWLIY